MVQYTFGVLDALGIRNGAVHAELKLEARGPVLIEANCRLHGGEGTWAPMAAACVGYSAVGAKSSHSAQLAKLPSGVPSRHC